MNRRERETDDDDECEADKCDVRGAAAAEAGRSQYEIGGPHDPGDERRDDERVDALTVAQQPNDPDCDAEREGRDGDCDRAACEPREGPELPEPDLAIRS